jgi:BCCT family betaine/carnitine transporter
MSYAPFIGLFVTRISRGRTIREVIVGMLVFGSLGCALFYMVVGNFAMHLELTGQLAVTEIVQNQGGPVAVVAVLDHLPWAWGAIVVFALVSLAFSATTLRRSGPGRWLRVFWALAITSCPRR